MEPRGTRLFFRGQVLIRQSGLGTCGRRPPLPLVHRAFASVSICTSIRKWCWSFPSVSGNAAKLYREQLRLLPTSHRPVDNSEGDAAHRRPFLSNGFFKQEVTLAGKKVHCCTAVPVA